MKPNEEAERDYDAAVQKGQLALLGSEITGDIFKVRRLQLYKQTK